MCGLFGMIRNEEQQSPEAAAAALTVVTCLGFMSETRGEDASGLAVLPLGAKAPRSTKAAPADVKPVQHADGWTVHRSTSPFHQFYDQAAHEPLLASAKVVVGHTRKASVGDKTKICNASPLLAGRLIGTHNGTVLTEPLRKGWDADNAVAETDSEVLYRALDTTGLGDDEVCDFAERLRGAAALAFVDRSDPTSVRLLRVKERPLAVAVDRYGNFYWGSEARWFDEIARMAKPMAKMDGFSFIGIDAVPEGTFLRVTVDGAQPFYQQMSTFKVPPDTRIGALGASPGDIRGKGGGKSTGGRGGAAAASVADGGWDAGFDWDDGDEPIPPRASARPEDRLGSARGADAGPRMICGQRTDGGQPCGHPVTRDTHRCPARHVPRYVWVAPDGKPIAEPTAGSRRQAAAAVRGITDRMSGGLDASKVAQLRRSVGG